MDEAEYQQVLIDIILILPSIDNVKLRYVQILF